MNAEVLRVSLARPRPRELAPAALAPGGARVVLGSPSDDIAALAAPIVPAADTLFGPRGMAATADGTLWVADTGHHRLLGWASLPQCDGVPADWLIGQSDFSREGRNARGAANACSLNVPTGVAACGDGIAVADAWNHRVLIWRRTPRASHVAADVVLGQPDFSSVRINRGADRPEADTLYWPYGVHFDGTSLWVADTGNRRVLRWNAIPERNGQPADAVLGQRDFRCRDENAGGDVALGGLRWPHQIARWQGRLCVADAGNNRVLAWGHERAHGLAAPDHVLGQCDAVAVDHNRGEYWPTAASFNMPYGVAAHRDRLLVADTANSRVLRFDAPANAEAAALAGQYGFTDKGDNRWRFPARDSLCWPYALGVHGDLCLVADSGNNRVLVWEIAP